MSFSIYQASVPTLIRGLNQLQHILRKGSQYAELKGFDPAVLIHARLSPDMLPLARQIQIATDVAKGCGARLLGDTPPSYEDTESTFEELDARIEKTIAFLRSLSANDFDGAEQRAIQLKLGPYEVDFVGQTYLSSFVLPNFYFHLTTAYNILRHNGVELGKMDYLGAPA